jgi:hypothetical protein
MKTKTVIVQVDENGDREITALTDEGTYGWVYRAEAGFWRTSRGFSTTVGSWLDEVVAKAEEAYDYSYDFLRSERRSRAREKAARKAAKQTTSVGGG